MTMLKSNVFQGMNCSSAVEIILFDCFNMKNAKTDSKTTHILVLAHRLCNIHTDVIINKESRMNVCK